MTNVAVLITCYNRKTKTLRCLQNLFNQQSTDSILPSVDVYLTDDASTDGTTKAVIEQFPQVNLIKGNGNLFWNRGMHLAWEAAAKIKNYDFYLWLNDDTILYQDTLNTLLKTSNVYNNEKIIIGSTEEGVNSNEISYGGRGKQGQLIIPSDNSKDCYYFNGNVVLVPKIIYQSVGNIDNTFHHSLGDFDYGLRASNLGYGAKVAPGYLGICPSNKDLPTWSNPEKNFSQRWQAFRTPLGQNPEEFFIFEKRHRGIIVAIFHYATNHLRVFLPKIWL